MSSVTRQIRNISWYGNERTWEFEIQLIRYPHGRPVCDFGENESDSRAKSPCMINAIATFVYIVAQGLE